MTDDGTHALTMLLCTCVPLNMIITICIIPLDLSMPSAFFELYPDAKYLLCWWHVDRYNAMYYTGWSTRSFT